jgi:hypothetical protein
LSAKQVAATILVDSSLQNFCKSFRNHFDQMGVWLLLPALSLLVELVLVALSCLVGVTGAAILVLLQWLCEVLGFLLQHLKMCSGCWRS